MISNYLSKKSVQYGFALLIGGILFIVFFQVIGAAIAESSHQTVTVANFQGVKPRTEIEELELALQSKDLSPYDRSLYEAKLKTAQREATQKAQPKPDNSAFLFSQKQTAMAQATGTPSYSESVRPTGLISEPPIGSITRNAVFSSVWVQRVNDTYIQVGAGHLINDKNQGVVYFLIESPRKVIEFLVPGKMGNLFIKGKEGDKISISSESGITLYFDLKNQTLTDSTGNNVYPNTPTALPPYP